MKYVKTTAKNSKQKENENKVNFTHMFCYWNDSFVRSFGRLTIRLLNILTEDTQIEHWCMVYGHTQKQNRELT